MATKSKKSPKAKPARKPAAKKPAPKPAKKPVVKPKAAKAKPSKAKTAKPAKPRKSAAKPVSKPVSKTKSVVTRKKVTAAPVKLTGFLAKQRERLLALKDTLLDSMNGVAKDSLRSRAEGSEASAFGMHQADAGSDAYDRDFALSLLSQEQDSLYEINQALKRLETGSYGICEMSGKSIPHARLEALPFTRYTVECQADIEKRNRFSRVRQPVASLFGLGEDEGGEGEDDDSSADTKD